LMGRLVALKVINPRLVASPQAVERFRREVRAAARLAHPNIVAAYDADQAGGTHFLVMEYVEGATLAQLIAEKGRLAVARACDYARQAAWGLQHAFEQGMVHRDVKPQNLMLTPGGRVKVLDFGLARFATESIPTGAPDPAEVTTDAAPRPEGVRAPLEPLTRTGVVMGTPDYIAPEQAADPHLADTRADIYSLGCTLYELLAGRPPFPERSVVDKVMAHAERTLPPLGEVRGDVPPRLARVVQRMMAKDPARRYQTPAEAAEALTPFAAAPQAASRGRLLLALAGLFVLGLAGFLLLQFTRRGEPPGRNQQIPWSEEAVREGRIPAPDLTKAALLYHDEFNDPQSGWPRGTTPYWERGYEAGRYYIRGSAPNTWHAWDSPLKKPRATAFACQVVGRIADQKAGAWGLGILTDRGDDKPHGLQVMINSEGRLKVEPSLFESERSRGPYVGPATHRTLKGPGEFNTLLVVIRGRRVEVYANSVAVLNSIRLDRDIIGPDIPAKFQLVAFASEKGVRAEFERFTVWSAEGLPELEARGD
ncbi:MAG TPA: serine/threonine-protein kinase, partial [Gemmataceae bacterium]|nr:serine/threonine-protein kinase [Gemmataceae bacterium]